MSYIPDQLVYVSRSNREMVRNSFRKAGEGAACFSTFPVPVSKNLDKNLETARKWATVWPNKDANYTEETVNNTPRFYKILGIDIRGNGGRAYKVADENDRLFDLREDTLLDCVFNAEIKDCGRISDPLVWAVIGAQKHLIRVGSDLHVKLLAETSAIKAVETKTNSGAYFTKSNLTPGKFYKASPMAKARYFFIGYINTYEREPGQCHGFFNTGVKEKIPKLLAARKAALFVQINNYGSSSRSIEEDIKCVKKIASEPIKYKINDTTRYTFFSIEIKTSCKFLVEEDGSGVTKEEVVAIFNKVKESQKMMLADDLNKIKDPKMFACKPNVIEQQQSYWGYGYKSIKIGYRALDSYTRRSDLMLMAMFPSCPDIPNPREFSILFPEDHGLIVEEKKKWS